MRKSRKYIVTGGVLAGLLVGGAAFAYWTTGGSGTGDGSTTAGNGNAVTIHQASLNPMFPGDSAQDIVLTASNGDNTNQSVHVSSVDGVLSVTGDCDPTDFQVDGAQLPLSGAFTTSWSAVEVAANTTSLPQTVANINFFNKTGSTPADNQDGCKSASVSIAYTSH